MDKEITNEVQEDLITWLKEKIDGAEGFVLEQAPLYCQELLAYEELTSIFCLIAAVIWILIFSIFLIVANKRGWMASSGDYDHFMIPSMIIGLMGLTFSVISLPVNTFTLIKIKTAPRVFILDHITNNK